MRRLLVRKYMKGWKEHETIWTKEETIEWVKEMDERRIEFMNKWKLEDKVNNKSLILIQTTTTSMLFKREGIATLTLVYAQEIINWRRLAVSSRNVAFYI